MSGTISCGGMMPPNSWIAAYLMSASLPTSYSAAIAGREIGPSAGSCGTAAYRRTPVITSDIATDPLWADDHAVALAHGLRACWSTPILSSDRSVPGTFAIYHREPRSPTSQQQAVLDRITHLASIALERKRAAEALRASEKFARGQVEALKCTLDALATESAPDRLVEHVMRIITKQLDAHSVSVWQKDETSNWVNLEFAFEGGPVVAKSAAASAAISRTLRNEDIGPLSEVFAQASPPCWRISGKGLIFHGVSKFWRGASSPYCLSR